MQKQFQPATREIGKMTVYFRDKYTTVVFVGSLTIVFHRWFDRRRGNYRSNWQPFTQILKQRNTIDDIYEIYRLAERYNVEHLIASEKYEIPQDIRKLPRVFRKEKL